jgi:hypothetical protein
MQILRRLLFRNRSQSGQNQKIRGLSTAELVGIIVIVGVLGALGGTYVVGLVTAAKNNTGDQNAQNLQTVMTSAFAGGAIVATTGPGNIDLTNSGTAYADLVGGVTVTNGTQVVSYQVSPAPVTAASYVLTVTGTPSITNTGIWSFTHGSAP